MFTDGRVAAKVGCKLHFPLFECGLGGPTNSQDGPAANRGGSAARCTLRCRFRIRLIGLRRRTVNIGVIAGGSQACMYFSWQSDSDGVQLAAVTKELPTYLHC